MKTSLTEDDLKQIERIKADLPYLPDDPALIEHWLLFHAKKWGWPTSPKDSLRWLHEGLPLEHLQSLRWNKEEMHLTRKHFTDGDWGPIALRINYLKTRIDPYMDKEIKDSLEFNLSHLKTHKALIHPVILEENPPGTFRVLDANHRLSAYFYLRGDFGVDRDEDKGFQVPEKLWAWVGRPQIS
jgi:hypothetical protein